ncbi:unnamed protein product [Gongylonema pulchrum]|uniref:Uncharacterized protein n=1 Tax=Gongylonema pulchrum TaxID=637853 RepID=A0A183D8W6_9BILA|nr:unnamed protein product [Gongylonema pulchrum]
MMAFAAECVYASLEMVVNEDGLDCLEMKLGLLQQEWFLRIVLAVFCPFMHAEEKGVGQDDSAPPWSCVNR